MTIYSNRVQLFESTANSAENLIIVLFTLEL